MTSKLGKFGRPRVVISALVVVAIALLAFDGVSGWNDYRSAQTAKLRPVVLDTARWQVISMLSYSPSTVDSDMTHAAAGLAKPLQEQFLAIAHQQVIPAAQQQGISTHSSVSETSIIDVSPESAHLLLFVDQTTTAAGDPRPKLSASTLRVGMTNLDGRWLVSDVTPL